MFNVTARRSEDGRLGVLWTGTAFLLAPHCRSQSRSTRSGL